MGFNVVIEISAPAERVWASLTDVERWPEWTSSMTSVTRIGGGPLAVGSQARIKQPKFGTMVWTVTELNRVQSFVWKAARPGLTLVAGHYLSSLDQDTVSLTLSVEQSGLVGRVVEPLTANITKRYVQLEADGLKRWAETSE